MYQTPPEPWDDEGWARFGREDYEAARAITPAITQAAKVQVTPIEWLWERYVPLGALTLLDGHPDTGKSSITLDLAARLSKARRMPDGSRGAAMPAASLLLNTEDTLARPVRERLEAAGADLELVYGLEVNEPTAPLGRPLVFPEDANVLLEAIGVTNAKLVVIDPIMGHLSSTVNSGVDQEVRRALNPLVRIANQTGAAILMVRHLRKPAQRQQAGPPSWLEGGGSSGGFGIVRAALQTTREDDSQTCTMWQTKRNYSDWARPIDYEFEAVHGHAASRIRWLIR